MSDYVEHPMILAGVLEDRAYQRVISDHAIRENLLAVLPTGLGKTAIALRVAAHFLQEQPEKSVLFLAPTRPLVEQHAHTVKSTLRCPPPRVLTGTVQPGTRHKDTFTGSIIVATPQVIANDLDTGNINLEKVSLLVFDEVHRARGHYPYVPIAGAYKEVRGGRVLGITASPGNNAENVREIMETTGVATTGLEVRDGTEDDVLPYLHGIKVEPLYVDSPAEHQRASSLLRHALDRYSESLRAAGLIPQRDYTTRRDLLDAGKRLGSAIALHKASGEKVPPDLWQAMSKQSVAMKVAHAIELVETQGVESLGKYLERMRTPDKLRSPSTRLFFKDEDVREAAKVLEAAHLEHPKLAKAVELVRDELRWHEGSRVILFAHYRDTADALVQRLKDLKEGEIRPARFVGQASKGVTDLGLTQKEQASLLDDFRAGRLNCLVATSVAEEGLDIPQTDLVVFYEPVPSEIRTIQRRGRTGRARAGRVVVLLTRGTQDVSAHFSARGKENRMKHLIEELKGVRQRPASSRVKRQTSLDTFSGGP